MLRSLYLRSVARRHIGEAILTNGPDGILQHVGWLGIVIETPDGSHRHQPWSEIDWIATGLVLGEHMEKARARANRILNGEETKAPQPALSLEEIERLMAS